MHWKILQEVIKATELSSKLSCSLDDERGAGVTDGLLDGVAVDHADKAPIPSSKHVREELLQDALQLLCLLNCLFSCYTVHALLGLYVINSFRLLVDYYNIVFPGTPFVF